MAFKKAQKITLSDLDRVSKEYESLLKTTEKTYADWDLKKDEAFETISTVEEIASSISHTPFTINRKLKKLHIQKADYKDKETIEREKRKEDLITGSGVIAVLGAGAAAAVSFWDYVVDFVSKRAGGKIGKNYVVWLIVGILVLIALVFLLIGWAINRWRTARKAEKNTIKLLKCISELKEKEARASSLTTELAAQCTILDQYLEALEQYRGVNFKGLPKEAQKDIVLMVDEAILLSELMSKENT